MAGFMNEGRMLSIWRVAQDVPAGGRQIVHTAAQGRVVGLVFSSDALCREPDFQVQFVRLVHRRGSYVLEPLRSFGDDTLKDVSRVASSCAEWVRDAVGKIRNGHRQRELEDANRRMEAVRAVYMNRSNGTAGS